MRAERAKRGEYYFQCPGGWLNGQFNQLYIATHNINFTNDTVSVHRVSHTTMYISFNVVIIGGYPLQLSD